MKSGSSTVFVRPLKACGVGLALVVFSQSVLAQTESEPAGSSYHERWRVFKPGSGTKDVDPNVYVYTAEFAKRFQMPEEWISTELDGVDAVAFRVVPAYTSCGWGGDPKACRTDEVRCEMDMYFDHRSNPLPWDERYPEVVADQYRSSSRFIPAYTRWSRLPKHSNDLGWSSHSPFIDQKSRKGLGWQYFTSLDASSGWGWMGLRSYDKEIFTKVSQITLSTSCTHPNAALALASSGLNRPFSTTEKSVVRSVLLPKTWQVRVQQRLRESKGRSEAFFEREGEKAMKALRESPVPSQSIISVQ